jgi:hypothetical protein
MTDLRIQLARDLRTIKQMFRNLRSEAFNRAGDPDMPGGAAMVLLGPSTNYEAWNYRQLSEIMGRTNEGTEGYDLDSDPLPPLMMLASWEDIIRDARDQPVWLNATIARSADYIRDSLDWLTAFDEYDEPNFMDMDLLAEQIHAVTARLEGVLHDGIRLTRIKARCMWCDQAPRLAVRYMDDPDKDHWYCPNKGCGHIYDTEGVVRALHHELHVSGEDGWITLTDASANTGRNIKTLRWWATPPPPWSPKIESRRNPRTDRVEVKWSEVRDMHKARPTRESIPRSA